jgi:hypothetical protein
MVSSREWQPVLVDHGPGCRVDFGKPGQDAVKLGNVGRDPRRDDVLQVRATSYALLLARDPQIQRARFGFEVVGIHHVGQPRHREAFPVNDHR